MMASRTELCRLQDVLEDQIDLFICCASFEDRCVSVPMSVGPVASCIVFYNEEFHGLLKHHLDSLERRFEHTMDICPLRADDPMHTVNHIVKSVNGLWPVAQEERKITIGIDITTFTRESLLILMKYLWLRMESWHEYVLFYNRATEYSLGVSQQDKWLSRGIKEVRSVIGYPGTLFPTRPIHLVVLTGFEDERAVRLVSECEPSYVSLGVADPDDAHTEQHQRINEDCRRRVANMSGNVEYFTFSAYSLVRAYNAINAQVSKFDDRNSIVAPMNTKISTIGASLVGLQDPDVQLCYAQADLYNFRNYSAASDDVHVIRICKADLSRLRPDSS